MDISKHNTLKEVSFHDWSKIIAACSGKHAQFRHLKRILELGIMDADTLADKIKTAKSANDMWCDQISQTYLAELILAE